MKRKRSVKLSNLDKHILYDLSQKSRNLQDRNWLELNEKRLMRLQKGGLVVREGQFWTLTPMGGMISTMHEDLGREAEIRLRRKHNARAEITYAKTS